ncbi:MAG: inositol monophosphatase family protein [Candidatus Diapherotrites archaeon]
MDELKAAEAAARKAGNLVLRRFGSRLTVRHKGRVDLVTDADVKAERMICAALEKKFPQHGFILEEGHAKNPQDGRVWVIDPIDGTTNFSHANPFFCISIGLYKGGEALLGVVYDPIRGEMFSAQKSGGATLNGRRIGVSSHAKLIDCLVGADFPYERGKKSRITMRQYSAILTRSQGMRTSGAAALELCHIACGRIDAFFHHSLKPYDTAAASIIVREAGGKTTDFAGKPYDIFKGHIVASNGRVHSELLRALGAKA